MLRLTFLKYLSQNQYTTNNILQNGKRINYALGCQCISSVSRVQKFINNNNDTDSAEVNHMNSATKLIKHKKFTDKEFFVRLRNDPDTFGPPTEKEIIDEGDLAEEKFFTEQPNPSQKLRTKQYADIIKAFIRQHKIKDAIDVVEVRMLKLDRVKPENYLYNLLLGACGRVGYTKKAFRLYNDMKKRGLKVTGGTYTALFNACANSPWPLTDGLTRATHLRNIMIEKGYEPNETNYNVMIKAFGRCGDLPTAFTIVDEMCSKHIALKSETFNFLLQACISDKEAGFRHALLVWSKLMRKRIPPNLYTYNLMLRCIRDCGLGDIEVTQDVINKIVSGNTKKLDNVAKTDAHKSLQITSEVNKNEVYAGTNKLDYLYKNNENADELNTCVIIDEKIVQPTTIKNMELIDQRPNLMARIPHLGSLISLSEIKTPEERLLLVGGCSGFLNNMKESQCMPDIKTFTQMLDNIPSTLAAEKELMSSMKTFNVKPDIDFYNMLIKRRSIRFDFESAKEVLGLMKQQKYKPNLITYGVLALSCKNKEEALELIDEMESKSYRLNIQILGAMLYQACFHDNISYILQIMEKCLTENIQVSKRFMTILEEYIKNYKKSLYAKVLTHSQEKAYRVLTARYKTWVQEIQIDGTEDAHPWEQYRENNEQDVSFYRWKEGVRFKPQHTSRFKVKTSAKYQTKTR